MRSRLLYTEGPENKSTTLFGKGEGSLLHFPNFLRGGGVGTVEGEGGSGGMG